MDFLDPQEAEKINKQKWKQFWWIPCIVAYFQNQRSKTTKFTKMLKLLAKFFYTVPNDHTVDA